MELGGSGLDMRFCWEIDEKKKTTFNRVLRLGEKAVRASREYPTLHGETVKDGAPEFVAGSIRHETVDATRGYELAGLSALGLWLYLYTQGFALGWYRGAPLALEAIRRGWIFGERHNFGFFSN